MTENTHVEMAVFVADNAYMYGGVGSDGAVIYSRPR